MFAEASASAPPEIDVEAVEAFCSTVFGSLDGYVALRSFPEKTRRGDRAVPHEWVRAEGCGDNYQTLSLH